MSRKDFSELESARRRVQILKDGFDSRLDELLISEFPADSPSKLVLLIKSILDKVSEKSQHLTDVPSINLICSLFSKYSFLLANLDNANVRQTPKSLVYILTEISKSINPDSVLVLHPQAVYNYGIGELLIFLKTCLKNLLSKSEIDNLFSSYKGPLYLVTFPEIERDNLLNHAILGHEMGHPLADEFIDQENNNPKYSTDLSKAQGLLFKEYSTELAKITDPFEKLDVQTKLVEDLIYIRKRALQELISDVTGTFIFGPSFLFAQYDFLKPLGLDHLPIFSEYYPPSRYRIRLIKKYLMIMVILNHYIN